MADPAIQQALDQALHASGIAFTWKLAVSRMLHLAMIHPLTLPDSLGSLPVCRAERVLKELRFLIRFPGKSEHGLQGSLDVLLRHEGRAWIIDWKSNLLPDYGPDQLEAVVQEHYALQVQIYTLAALRLLRICSEEDYKNRFGGVLYVFLRGLPDGGVWSLRPSWTEIRTWEETLAKRGLELGHG